MAENFYRVAKHVPIVSIDPQSVGSSIADPILKLVFEPLVRIDETLKVVPALAESWEIDSIRRSIRFRLRKGVKFHHGRELTSEDVLHSLRRFIESERPGAHRFLNYKEIARNELAVDSTIVINSKHELSIRLNTLDFDSYLRSLSVSDAYIVPHDLASGAGIGTGPYRLIDRDKVRHKIRLERVAPSLKNSPQTIQFEVIPSSKIVGAMEAGEIDEFDTSNYYELLESPKNAKKYPIFMPAVKVLTFSSNSEIFRTAENRIEFTALFPKEILFQELYSNLSPAYSVLPEELFGFAATEPESKIISKNRQEFLSGLKSTRRVVVGLGRRDEVETYRALLNTDPLIARGWQFEIVYFETLPELKSSLKKGEVDLVTMQFFAKYYDPLTILEMFSSLGEALLASAKDPTFNQILSEAISSPAKDRLSLYRSADAYLVEKAYVIPLAQVVASKFVRNNSNPPVLAKGTAFWDEIGVPSQWSQGQVSIGSTYAALRIANARLSDYERLEQEAARHKDLARLIAQLNHDLQSPLAALSIIDAIWKTEESVERSILRSAIHRIQEIARSSLQSLSQRSLPTAGPFLVFKEIHSIIDEKKIQWPDCSLSFVNQIQETDDILFVGSKIEFGRMISNLLNNAFEASSLNVSPIVITASATDTEWLILIRDEGRGLTRDEVSILNKNERTTFLKRDGQGLGVSHAKTTMQSFEGNLSIFSELNKGTTVTLSFPRDRLKQ